MRTLEGADSHVFKTIRGVLARTVSPVISISSEVTEVRLPRMKGVISSRQTLAPLGSPAWSGSGICTQPDVGAVPFRLPSALQASSRVPGLECIGACAERKIA